MVTQAILFQSLCTVTPPLTDSQLDKMGWQSRLPYYDYPLKRLPPEPHKWLGIQGAMAYYRWLDKK